MCYPLNINDSTACNSTGRGYEFTHGGYMPPMVYHSPVSAYDRGYGDGKAVAVAVGVGVGAILTYWLLKKLQEAS